MKKSFLFITCEEAFHICDKSQYGEASLWEKFKLNLRLVWCNITRSYVKRNRKLTKTIEKAHVDYLKSSEKIDLKLRLEQELKSQQ